MKVKLVIKGNDYSHIVYRVVGALYIILAVIIAYVGYNMKVNNMSFNPKTTVIIFVFVVLYLVDKASEYISRKKK